MATETSRTQTVRGSRLGERLRQLRVAAGLTQSELAADRFSKEYISQIERGKTRPTAETVEWLAARLGVETTFLASGVSSDERARAEAMLTRAEALTEKLEFAGVRERARPRRRERRDGASRPAARR
jgi:transcriptional regulator with XRE-family HTH domain